MVGLYINGFCFNWTTGVAGIVPVQKMKSIIEKELLEVGLDTTPVEFDGMEPLENKKKKQWFTCSFGGVTTSQFENEIDKGCKDMIFDGYATVWCNENLEMTYFYYDININGRWFSCPDIC